MTLLSNWRDVLRKAWSVRFMALGILLESAEYVLPIVNAFVDIPEGLFRLLSIAAFAFAFLSRFVKQKGLSDGD